MMARSYRHPFRIQNGADIVRVDTLDFETYDSRPLCRSSDKPQPFYRGQPLQGVGRQHVLVAGDFAQPELLNVFDRSPKAVSSLLRRGIIKLHERLGPGG